MILKLLPIRSSRESVMCTRRPSECVQWLRASLLALTLAGQCTIAIAQTGNDLVVFEEDAPAQKTSEQILRQQAIKPTAIPVIPQQLDFQAPQIEFRKESNEIVGKGGVVIAEGGVQVQANEGVFNTQTKEGDVKGDVLMTTSAGVLAADSAKVNVQSETGDFSGLEFDVEEGGYRVEAEQAKKVSEFEFELLDSDMTTCRCPDGDKPWEISSSRCHLTQEGYAHAYGSTVYFEGLPIVYAPYLVFPVKNERASGLLPAQFGVNSRDGFQYLQPIFLSVDESTGFTFTPFFSAKSRIGSELTFEKVFSETSQLDAGILYSNESRRKGQLRGLVVDGIDDPSIDENRFGGFWRQRWLSDKEDPTPVEFIADGRYTSDNVFLREIQEANIGTPQDQFLTSTALVRGTAFNFLNLEGRTEYNQMLITPQDLQFQRVPELAAAASETFRPFGQNALGAKVVTSADVVATDFVRQDGYDGWRLNMHPKVALPFHVQNYFRAAASAELHQTQYSLRDTMLPSQATPLPDGSTELEDSNSRTVPILSYGMSSGVEKVYDLERGNWFSKLVGLGAYNEGQELTRLKHTIEPLVNYTYIPEVDQDDLPLFDQLDRFRERSLLTYGFESRLYGRFFEPYERTREIEELTSADDTLPMFDMNGSLLDFGRGMVLAPESNVDTREGAIRELGLFRVRQGYDWVEERKDLDPNRDGLTDVNIGLSLSPSYYFSTAFDSNVNTDSGDFSSYFISLAMRDDRDDVLRTRYNFVDGRVSQIEGNFELKLSDRLKAGAYGLYDTNTDEFLQSQGLLRFQNSCKCWSLDFGVGQRINPDRRQVMLTFTFGGVGSLRQGIGVSND